MRDRIVFFFVLGILISAGIFCYTQLEITGTTRRVKPLRQARQNPYLALERWIAKRGQPVRTLARGDIDAVLAAPEKTVFIEASAFDWSDYKNGEGDEDNNIPSRLTSWIKSGGNLIISIDTYTTDWYLASYLKTLGIEEAGEEDAIAWDDEDESDGGEDETHITADGETVDYDSLPALDRRAAFVISEQNSDVDKVSVINGFRYVHPDKAVILPEKIVFAHLAMGKGSLAVMGEAEFLHYRYLGEAPNADLAGALFLGEDTGGGVLLVKSGGDEKYLFGNLAERGNPLPLLVSAIVLLIAGFWMALPLFGRTRPVTARPGKPLRERFLAEGRFLFKYGALDNYLKLYEAELERAGQTDTAPPTGAKPPEGGDHHQKNQPTPPQSGRGMVVLVRYLSQGTYPLYRPRGAGYVPFAYNKSRSLRHFMKCQLHYIEKIQCVKYKTRSLQSQERS